MTNSEPMTPERELAEVRAENATLHADKLGLMQALGRFTGDA